MANAREVTDNIVSLVREKPISHDTVHLLFDLLDQARKGKITGLAVVALHPGRVYELATTGEAERSPTYLLGVLSKLQVDIAQKIESD